MLTEPTQEAQVARIYYISKELVHVELGDAFYQKLTSLKDENVVRDKSIFGQVKII